MPLGATPFETLLRLAQALGLVQVAQVAQEPPAPRPRKSEPPPPTEQEDRGRAIREGAALGLKISLLLGAAKRFGMVAVLQAVAAVRQQVQRRNAIRDIGALFWALAKGGCGPNLESSHASDRGERSQRPAVDHREDRTYAEKARADEARREKADLERRQQTEQALAGLDSAKREELLTRARQRIADQLREPKLRRGFLERTRLEDPRVLAEARAMLLSG